MAEGHASSSKPKPKGGKGGKNQRKPLVKSNVAKRERVDEELRDLQQRIDDFVSDGRGSYC